MGDLRQNVRRAKTERDHQNAIDQEDAPPLVIDGAGCPWPHWDDQHYYEHDTGVVAPICVLCGAPNPTPLTDVELAAYEAALVAGHEWWASMRRAAGLNT